MVSVEKGEIKVIKSAFEEEFVALTKRLKELKTLLKERLSSIEEQNVKGIEKSKDIKEKVRRLKEGNTVEDSERPLEKEYFKEYNDILNRRRNHLPIMNLINDIENDNFKVFSFNHLQHESVGIVHNEIEFYVPKSHIKEYLVYQAVFGMDNSLSITTDMSAIQVVDPKNPTYVEFKKEMTKKIKENILGGVDGQSNITSLQSALSAMNDVETIHNLKVARVLDDFKEEEFLEIKYTIISDYLQIKESINI